MAYRRPLAIAVVVSLACLNGCSSSSDPVTSPASAAPTESTALAQLPAITFEQPGEGDVCLKTIGGTRSIAALDTGIRVNTDLVITDVSTEGSSQAVLLTKDSFNLPPINAGGSIAYGALVDWPLTQKTASSNVRWAARDALIGRSYAAGETGLPVLHIVGKPGGSVATVVYHYTSAAEPSGEARYDLDLKFATRC